MTEVAWERHSIDEIGLSFEVNPYWAVDVHRLEGGAIVSQRSPDDAVFFVRYGSGQTLDAFVAGLGNLLTTATVLNEAPVEFAGHPANHMSIVLHRPGKPIPGRPTYVPNRVEVTGFKIRSVPVLVGYRIPDKTSDEVRAAVERITGSIEVASDA